MIKFSFVVIFILLFSGCSPRIIQFVNDDARFSAYQTFYTVNYKNSDRELSAEGQRIMSSIRELINDQMLRRDYKRDNNEPDLLVRYELISNQRTETDVVRDPFINPYSYYPNRYFRTRTYLESALLIEITDHETRKLVWQASVDLNKYAKKDNDKEILQKAINQLFNTYLYRAGSNKPDETLIVE